MARTAHVNSNLNAKSIGSRRRKRAACFDQNPGSDSSSLFSGTRSNTKRRRMETVPSDENDSDSSVSSCGDSDSEDSDVEMTGPFSTREGPRFRARQISNQSTSNIAVNWMQRRNLLNSIGRRRRLLSTGIERARILQGRRRARLWNRSGHNRPLVPNSTTAASTSGDSDSSNNGFLRFFENSTGSSSLGQFGSGFTSRGSGEFQSQLPTWSAFSANFGSNAASNATSLRSTSQSTHQSADAYDMSSLVNELGALGDSNNEQRNERKRPRKESRPTPREAGASNFTFGTSFTTGNSRGSSDEMRLDQGNNNNNDEEMYVDNESSVSGAVPSGEASSTSNNTTIDSSHSLEKSVASASSPQNPAALTGRSRQLARLPEEGTNSGSFTGIETHSAPFVESFNFQNEYGQLEIRSQYLDDSEIQHRLKLLPARIPASMKGITTRGPRFNFGPSSLPTLNTDPIKQEGEWVQQISQPAVDPNSEVDGDDMMIETSPVLVPIIHDLGETFWTALSLDSNPNFKNFSEEFSSKDGISLFRTARDNLKTEFTFQQLLLDWANETTQKTEPSSKLRKGVSFDDNIAIIGEVNFFTALDSKRGPGQGPGRSILKVKTHRKQLGFLPYEEFRHTRSEKKKSSLERKLRAKVSECQQYVREIATSSELADHEVTTVGFRDCFNFSRKHFARVTSQQILSFIFRLYDIRNNVDSVFYVFVGLGCQYTTILDLLGISSTSESLNKVEDKLKLLTVSLTNSGLLLEGLNNTIAQMGEVFAESVTGWTESLHDIIINRTETEEFFDEYCKCQSMTPEEVSSFRKYTHFDKLFKESDLLVKNIKLLQAPIFQNALENVQSRLSAVRNVSNGLQSYVSEIRDGVANLHLRFDEIAAHDHCPVEREMTESSDTFEVESEDELMD